MRSCDGLMAEYSRSVPSVGKPKRSRARTARQLEFDRLRKKIQADKRLGNTPDKDLASEYGVSETFVNKARGEVGITPFNPKVIRWSPEIEKLLGVIPDCEIGRRYGIPKQTVCGRRTRAGIPPAAPRGKRQVGRVADEVFPLHYPRSEELRNAIEAIKQDRITERLARGWGDYAAHGRVLHSRHYLWAAELRSTALHRNAVYLPRVSWSVAIRNLRMGDGD